MAFDTGLHTPHCAFVVALFSYSDFAWQSGYIQGFGENFQVQAGARSDFLGQQSGLKVMFVVSNLCSRDRPSQYWVGVIWTSGPSKASSKDGMHRHQILGKKSHIACSRGFGCLSFCCKEMEIWITLPWELCLNWDYETLSTSKEQRVSFKVLVLRSFNARPVWQLRKGVNKVCMFCQEAEVMGNVLTAALGINSERSAGAGWLSSQAQVLLPGSQSNWNESASIQAVSLEKVSEQCWISS